ncbi:MAG: hypothetical protein L0H70_08655, partial [Xanthomonadales bacterium]|nr:hypothetical protein [Xanthomonadales bacterium]
MWREVLRFELRQQLRAPLFWIVAVVFALLAFAFITTDAVSIGGGMGNVHRNAPIVIIRMLAVFSLIGMFLVAIFVAGAGGGGGGCCPPPHCCWISGRQN